MVWGGGAPVDYLAMLEMSWKYGEHRLRQGPSFKEVDSRLVAFRLIQLRLANGVTCQRSGGFLGFFGWFFDVFWLMVHLHLGGVILSTAVKPIYFWPCIGLITCISLHL